MWRRVMLLALWVPAISAQVVPIAHWRLDEVTGIVAADSSPSGNHGALVGFGGASWTTGALGQVPGSFDHAKGLVYQQARLVNERNLAPTKNVYSVSHQ